MILKIFLYRDTIARARTLTQTLYRHDMPCIYLFLQTADTNKILLPSNKSQEISSNGDDNASFYLIDLDLKYE